MSVYARYFEQPEEEESVYGKYFQGVEAPKAPLIEREGFGSAAWRGPLSGAAGAVGAGLSGLAETTRDLQIDRFNPLARYGSAAMDWAGGHLQDASQSLHEGMDPAQHGTWFGDEFAPGVGSMAAFLGTGAVGRGAGAAQAAGRALTGRAADQAVRRGGQMGQFGTAGTLAWGAGYDEAGTRMEQFIAENPDLGLDYDSLPMVAGRMGGGIGGLIQIANLNRYLDPIVPASTKRPILSAITRRLTSAAISEAIVEGVGGGLVQNLVQRSYDGDQDLMQDVLRRAGTGGAVSLFTTMLMLPMQGRNLGRHSRMTREQVEERVRAGEDPNVVLNELMDRVDPEILDEAQRRGDFDLDLGTLAPFDQMDPNVDVFFDGQPIAGRTFEQEQAWAEQRESDQLDADLRREFAHQRAQEDQQRQVDRDFLQARTQVHMEDPLQYVPESPRVSPIADAFERAGINPGLLDQASPSFRAGLEAGFQQIESAERSPIRLRGQRTPDTTEIPVRQQLESDKIGERLTDPVPRDQLPPNLADPRLMRTEYRGSLKRLASELTEGGGTELVPRPGATPKNRRPTGDVLNDYGPTDLIRTPSLNPQWFQSLAEDTGLTVRQVKTAVDRALEGRKLGTRQTQAIERMLDHTGLERAGGDESGPMFQTWQEMLQHYRDQVRPQRGEMSDAQVDQLAEGRFPPEMYAPDMDAQDRALMDMALNSPDIDATMEALRQDLDETLTFQRLWEIEQGRADGQVQAEQETGAPATGETETGRPLEGTDPDQARFDAEQQVSQRLTGTEASVPVEQGPGQLFAGQPPDQADAFGPREVAPIEQTEPTPEPVAETQADSAAVAEQTPETPPSTVPDQETSQVDPRSLREASPGDQVDGRIVREDVPNQSSIDASLDEYSILDGIREVPVTAFDAEYVNSVRSGRLDRRTRQLADEIDQSGEVNPLIVVFDAEGPYVLEGGHRFDALIKSGAQSVPAMVVIEEAQAPPDTGQRQEAAAQEAPETPPESGVSASETVESQEAGQGTPRYSFAGEQARVADEFQLSRAKQRIAAGEDAETVRQEIGWFQGDDGRWRFEIDDSQAELSPVISALGQGARGGEVIGRVSYKREGDQWTLMLIPSTAQRTDDIITLRNADAGIVRAIVPDDIYARMERMEGNDDLIDWASDTPDAKLIESDFRMPEFNALPLGEVLSHPRLFEAYPQLRDVMVQVDPSVPRGGSLALSYDGMVVRVGRADQLSTILHEVQHGIQHIEGFAAGGTADQFRPSRSTGRDDLARLHREAGRLYREFQEQADSQRESPVPDWSDVDAETRREFIRRAQGSLYNRLSGEVEARNVQARRLMTPEQRRTTSPDQTRDIPSDQAIIVYNGEVMESAPAPANAAETGTTAEAVKESLTPRARRSLIDSGLVTITESPAQWPGNHPADAAGAWINGKIWLASNNIQPGSERGLILHEVGVHHGLESMLGDQYQTLIRQLQRQVERGGRPGAARAQREAYEAHQRALADDTIQTEAARWEETIAYMAESGVNTGVMRRIVAAIRNFLRDLGLVRDFTNADVADLARGSVARIVDGIEAEQGRSYAPIRYQRQAGLFDQVNAERRQETQNLQRRQRLDLEFKRDGTAYATRGLAQRAARRLSRTEGLDYVPAPYGDQWGLIAEHRLAEYLERFPDGSIPSEAAAETTQEPRYSRQVTEDSGFTREAEGVRVVDSQADIQSDPLMEGVEGEVVAVFDARTNRGLIVAGRAGKETPLLLAQEMGYRADPDQVLGSVLQRRLGREAGRDGTIAGLLGDSSTWNRPNVRKALTRAKQHLNREHGVEEAPDAVAARFLAASLNHPEGRVVIHAPDGPRTTPTREAGDLIEPQSLHEGIDVPHDAKFRDKRGTAMAWTRLFESVSDNLRQTTGVEWMADRIDDYFDGYRAYLAEMQDMMYPALREFQKLPRAQRKQAEQMFGNYYRAVTYKGNPEQAYNNASPEAQALIDAWKRVADVTGERNQSLGVQVKDEGGWRPIGKAPEFFPRVFSDDTVHAIQNYKAHPEHWNKLVDALMAEGLIETQDDALKYIKKQMIPDVTSSDFHSSMEMARKQALPDVFYDWTLAPALQYIESWADRYSQIEQFGQDTGNGEMFEQAQKETLDQSLKEQMKAAQERIYNVTPNNMWYRGMQTLNTIATGAQIANPATGVILNGIGGTTLNWLAFGEVASLKAFAEMVAHPKDSFAYARKIGATKQDYLTLINDIPGQDRIRNLFGSGVNTTRALRRAVTWLMKYGGYMPTEHFIRTHGGLTAKHFLNDAIEAHNKNPKSRSAKQYRAFIERMNFDFDKLLRDGPGSRYQERWIRAGSNLTQGTYRIDQVPAFVDEPHGRFFLKYQKFGSQVNRLVWKHHLEPFVKSVTGKGETLKSGERVRSFVPMMRFFVATAVGGTAIGWAREVLFDYMRPGPGFDELEKALEDDDRARKLAVMMSRAYHSMNTAGAFGFIGNYAQFARDFTQQERVKNPLDPPGLAAIDAATDLSLRLIGQKQLSARDIDEVTEGFFALYRTVKRPVIKGIGLIDAENEKAKIQSAVADRRYISGVSARYAKDQGIEGGRGSFGGKWIPTPMTPVNREITDALRANNPAKARAIMNEHLSGLPRDERDSAMQSMRTRARNTQPLTLGGKPMSERQRKEFLIWARDHVGPENYERIVRADREYRMAARRAGLM